jgi:hypothetical protein
MTPQEKQEFEKIKAELYALKDLFYKGDFPDKKVFSKTLQSDQSIVARGTGMKIANKTNSAGVHFHCGVAINDAGIKTEVGHTCPNASTYYSSAAAQPIHFMVNTTWTLLNIP